MIFLILSTASNNIQIAIPTWLTIGSLLAIGGALVSASAAFTKMSKSNEINTKVTETNTEGLQTLTGIVQDLNITMAENNINTTNATDKACEAIQMSKENRDLINKNKVAIAEIRIRG